MKLIRGPLAKLRLKNKLTSEKAAESIGCSRTWLGKIERGEANPSAEIAEKMAATFNTSPEEILRLARLSQVQLLKQILEENK